MTQSERSLFSDPQGILLVKIALCATIAIGLWATYHLLISFSSVLKPLVYATMAFSVVQYASENIKLLLLGIFSRFGSLHPSSPSSRALDKDLQIPLRNARVGLVRIPFKRDPLKLYGIAVVSKGLAILLLIYLTIASVNSASSLIVSSVQATDFHRYQQGAVEVWNLTAPLVRKAAPEFFSSNVTSSHDLFQKGLQEASAYASYIESTSLNLAGLLSSAGSEIIFFLIYFILYCSAPIPETHSVVKVVGTYAALKTFCNLVYAFAVGIVLYALGVDLAAAIALLSFFFAYIPEIGAMIAIALPLPLILFDHSDPNITHRLGKSATVLVAMLLIKLVVSNGVEAKVMGSNQVLAGNLTGKDGQFEETHPIIVLVAVMIGAQIWDVTGMIVSVPVVALIRVYYTMEMETHLGSGGSMTATSSFSPRGSKDSRNTKASAA